ncbi:MAG: hypothetical protein FJ303_23695 [Planctomycetes bacterium]|nr:hypothetical protein [Planctomycetota bacterium]
MTSIIRRAYWLAVVVAILPSIGCTTFQTLTTNKWLDGSWVDGGADHAVNDVMTLWDNRVRITQDSVNSGRPLPGLVGRIYLFSNDRNVDAAGFLVVTMHDASKPNGEKLAEWRFDPKSLKLLKRKDHLGDGYTLFLPWEDYRPEMRQVKLQACYVPQKGAPRYTDPSRVTLQTEEEAIPPMITHGQIVPGAQRPTGTPVTLQGR